MVTQVTLQLHCLANTPDTPNQNLAHWKTCHSLRWNYIGFMFHFSHFGQMTYRPLERLPCFLTHFQWAATPEGQQHDVWLQPRFVLLKARRNMAKTCMEKAYLKKVDTTRGQNEYDEMILNVLVQETYTWHQRHLCGVCVYYIYAWEVHKCQINSNHRASAPQVVAMTPRWVPNGGQTHAALT